MARTARRPHLVAAIVSHGVSPFELSVACEVFGLDRKELVDPWYELRVCAAVEPPVRAKSSNGMTIDTPYRLDDVDQADTVVIPMWNVDDVPAAELVDALRAAHARGARILSFCSGAFLLAHAGLLDGRRATTHWMYAGLLRERFPAVAVEPDVLYVVDGNVMTSAGTAAAIDLCLYLVRSDHGAEVANAVARRMVVPPHRDGGQAQYIQAPVPVCAEDDPLRATLDWALEHLDEPLTVEALARRAATSPRTYARRFVAVTGTTPLQWLLRQRVVLAQRLLEVTDEPVERIATRCGFGTSAGMRVHFQRQVGTSPMAYRRTFQATSAAQEGAAVSA
ncbi:MAG: helix-turn-helix domain-containing protein [Acidimicrobiales bacterium]|nr:helix-turn-helix domain-containing protein [Acidimicrobiales bacterium]